MKTKTAESAGGAYPYAPLALCLPIAGAVSVLGGNKSPVSKSLLASHLGEDEKSQGLSFKITSAKCFGMIDGRGDYTLTDQAKRYFFPTIEHESRKALLSFLATPVAFKALLQRFDGSRLPATEMIGNILHKEACVPVSWKDRVAGFFVRSAQHVGVIDAGGFLRFRSAQLTPLDKTVSSAEYEDMKNPSAETTDQPVTSFDSFAAAANTDRKAANVWSFTHQGKTVRVETPAEISVELWKKLNGYIGLLQPSEDAKAMKT